MIPAPHALARADAQPRAAVVEAQPRAAASIAEEGELGWVRTASPRGFARSNAPMPGPWHTCWLYGSPLNLRPWCASQPQACSHIPINNNAQTGTFHPVTRREKGPGAEAAPFVDL